MAMGLPEKIRQEVASRAGYRCEYCALPQAYSLHPYGPTKLQHEQEDTKRANTREPCSPCLQYHHRAPHLTAFHFVKHLFHLVKRDRVGGTPD